MGKMRKHHGSNGENDGNMAGAPVDSADISRGMTNIKWPHGLGGS